MFSLNILAIMAGAVVYMILGFVWYNPKVFGTAWAKLVGRKMDEAEDASVGYMLTSLGALVASVVMSILVNYTNTKTLVDGAFLGFLVWAGFAATVTLNNNIFQGKPWKLFLIDTGYNLVGLVLMGAVLGMWR